MPKIRKSFGSVTMRGNMSIFKGNYEQNLFIVNSVKAKSIAEIIYGWDYVQNELKIKSLQEILSNAFKTRVINMRILVK